MADVRDRITAALSGSYRIDKELGAGGMATVYLAQDLKHQRRLARAPLASPRPGRYHLPTSTLDHSMNRFFRPARRTAAGLAALALIVLAGCKKDDAAGGGDSGDLSGTYSATTPDGTMTLEFKDGHKVHFTMLATGTPPDTASGDYLIDGNKVTVQIPGGMPLMLVIEGKALAGSMMGQILRFEKK